MTLPPFAYAQDKLRSGQGDWGVEGFRVQGSEFGDWGIEGSGVRASGFRGAGAGCGPGCQIDNRQLKIDNVSAW